MIVTDTHTHLYSDAFDEDRTAVVKRAIGQGVERFFIPAIDSTYSQDMFLLQQQFPKNIFLMTGLHPTHVKENFEEELAHIEQLLAANEFYAIGETGIDLYWDKTYLQEQRQAFIMQIQLAKRHKLPIVIHCRDAFEEVFEVLETEKGDGLYGIFHCFTGDLKQAKLAISYNMKLGIGGVVTFKNGKIDRFLNQIDIEHIVLETDAPYLAPVPYRGKRNESVYILEILQKVSELYDLDVEEVARITTENSKVIFGI